MRQGARDECLAGLVVLAVAFLAVAAVGIGSAAGVSAASTPGTTPVASFVAANAQVSGYDAIETRIDLRANGDARWLVEFRYQLADEATRRDFERARENVTNPPGVFVSRMERAVDEAEAATGRSMTVQNGSVETGRSVPAGRFGVVSYRFTWTNFASRAGGNRYELGDAIGGMRLGENESLWMEWPDSFGEESVSPPPAESQPNAVRWRGPLQFRTEDPTVALVATAGSRIPVSTLLLVGAVGLLILGAGGYWFARVRGGSSARTGSASERQADDEPHGDAVERRTAGDPDSGTAADQTAEAEDPAGTAVSVAAAAGDGTPEELLTDEERVLRLLEDADGRMKQQDLIAAVDWSRTKASDVVNEMHEEGQIELYRLGRENVLALPGEIDV